MLRYYCKVQAGIVGVVFMLCAVLLAVPQDGHLLRLPGDPAMAARTWALIGFAIVGAASLTLALFLHRRWR